MRLRIVRRKSCVSIGRDRSAIPRRRANNHLPDVFQLLELVGGNSDRGRAVSAAPFGSGADPQIDFSDVFPDVIADRADFTVINPDHEESERTAIAKRFIIVVRAEIVVIRNGSIRKRRRTEHFRGRIGPRKPIVDHSPVGKRGVPEIHIHLSLIVSDSNQNAPRRRTDAPAFETRRARDNADSKHYI